MITDLRPYPAIEDAGVAWLGSVPQHWRVLPNRGVFAEVNERDQPDAQMLSVTITRGVIPQQALLSDSSKKDASRLDRTAYKVVRPGDIVYNKMRAWQGAIGVSAYPGIVSPAYVVQRPRPGVNPRYFHYLLRTPAFAKEAERWSYGITSDMWSLRPEHFRMIYVCLPPPDEQYAIVRFLDHIDRRIGRYIRTKQRLIALLEEQKQAFINEAVTRGLDRGAALADPRVGWLGEVPAHWEVSALRHRYTQTLGKMLDTKRITGLHLVSYIRNTDVQWDRINTADLPLMDIAPDEYPRYTLRRGDLLVCEGGEVGRSAIWVEEQGRVGFQKALHRLRPRDAARDIPRFMLYALRAAAASGAFDDGHVSTIAHLTGDKLRAHRFAFPPVHEQAAIVEFLDELVARVNHAIDLTAKEIARLREYETRLAADVVRGHVDVRDAAAQVTDETAGEAQEFPAEDEGESEADLEFAEESVVA